MTRTTSFSLLVLLMVVNPFTLSAQTMEFRIDSLGTINGITGFFLSSRQSGVAYENDFLVDSNGDVALIAFQMIGMYNNVFQFVPIGTYWVKSGSMSIGKFWTSWIGEPTKSIVEDTAAVTVPAGTFRTYVVKEYSLSKPDSLLATLYFANTVGVVRMIMRGSAIELTSYSISGGSGYYPIAVGNRWVFGIATGVERQVDQLTPTRFSLRHNYPNPFNPSTIIGFELQKEANVSLRVFNTLGQLVATLIDEPKRAGVHQVQWNASCVPSGTYFYRLQAAGSVETGKMVLLK